MESEDAKLLKRYISGDEMAFSILVRKYESKIIGFFYKHTLNIDLARELTQEAFFRLIRSAKNIRGEASVGTYLYKVATNIFIDYKRKKEIELSEIDKSNIKVYSISEDEIANKELRLKILKSLLSLPESEKNALYLFYYEDKSIEEIAKLLNCSRQNVKNYLFRGRKRIANVLRKEKNEV